MAIDVRSREGLEKPENSRKRSTLRMNRDDLAQSSARKGTKLHNTRLPAKKMARSLHGLREGELEGHKFKRLSLLNRKPLFRV